MVNSLGRFIKLLIKVAASVSVAVLAMFGTVFVVMAVLFAIGVGIGMTSDKSYQDEFNYKHLYGSLSDDKLVVMPVNGLILGSRDEVTPFFELFSDTQVTYGYEVKQDLMTLAGDENIKGVILEINSPGGTIYGSRAIADGVAEYKKLTGQPVYAFVSGIAASGGYWAAVSADMIYADYGTGIGSIGVIMGPFKYYQDVVAESAVFGDTISTLGGISTEYITAGRFKDMGNPYRELTGEEREVLQDGVDQSYQDFIGFVAENRELTEEELDEEIGAIFYSDHQAVENGLVDELANKEEVYHLLADNVQLTDFQVVKYRLQKGFFESLSGVLGGLSQQSLGKTIQPAISICSAPSMVLAFDGDLSTFCR